MTNVINTILFKYSMRIMKRLISIDEFIFNEELEKVITDNDLITIRKVLNDS